MEYHRITSKNIRFSSWVQAFGFLVCPSFLDNDGEAVTGLDLCFLPSDDRVNELETERS